MVSVIIPAFNYGHYVVDAVESALAQTYPAMEIIVVDDGSTDDTRERLSPYLDRIQYIYQQNKGLSAARNTGILHSRGQWIALLDADDFWHPRKIEVQLDAVAGLGDVGLIGSPKNPGMPDQLPPDPEVRRLDARDFLLHSPVTPSSALVRRDCLAIVGGFDESLKHCEDRDMWLRMVSRFPAVQVLSPCWSCRVHGGQMSNDAHQVMIWNFYVMTRFFDGNLEHIYIKNMTFSMTYLQSAHSYLMRGDRVMCIKLLLKSAILWPWAFGGPVSTRWARLKILSRALLGESLFEALSSGRSSLPGRVLIPRPARRSVVP